MRWQFSNIQDQSLKLGITDDCQQGLYLLHNTTKNFQVLIPQAWKRLADYQVLSDIHTFERNQACFTLTEIQNLYQNYHSVQDYQPQRKAKMTSKMTSKMIVDPQVEFNKEIKRRIINRELMMLHGNNVPEVR